MDESHSKSMLAVIEERNEIIDSIKSEYNKQLEDYRAAQATHSQEIQSLQAVITSLQMTSSRQEIENHIKCVEIIGDAISTHLSSL